MLGFVVGTRPEIIKMAPIIKLAQAQNIPFKIIHTNQHRDRNMSTLFFDELDLPYPNALIKHQFGVMSILDVLQDLSVRTVLVQGDTNSVVCGAKAAKLLDIPLVHVEAGLRCGDMNMVEEKNRILVDSWSDILCAPTKIAVRNLVAEELHVQGRVHCTGNTVSDALRLYADRFKAPVLEPQSYFLVTIHRQENVDDPDKLKAMISAITDASNVLHLPAIIPMHPRTYAQVLRNGISYSPKMFRMSSPLGYFDFIGHLKNARMVLTDSGGVQEEACLLGVPCVTLRYCTERPETVNAGMNILASAGAFSVEHCVRIMADADIAPLDLYGDGKASFRILNLCGVL